MLFVDDIFCAFKGTSEFVSATQVLGYSCYARCEIFGFNFRRSSNGVVPWNGFKWKKPNTYSADILSKECRLNFVYSSHDKMHFDGVIFYGGQSLWSK